MVTFYRGVAGEITSDAAVIGGHRYPFAELHDLHVVRRPRSPLIHSLGLLGLTTLVAGLALMGSYRLFAIVATAVAVVEFGTYYVLLRRYPPASDLIGGYRGEDVVLFSSRNQQVFAQLCRALARAMEQRISL